MKSLKSCLVVCVVFLAFVGCATGPASIKKTDASPPAEPSAKPQKEFFIQDGEAKFWHIGVVEQDGKRTALDLSEKHQFNHATQRVMFLFKIIGDGRTVGVQRIINGQPGQWHQIEIGPEETVEFGVLGPMVPGASSMQVKLLLVNQSGDRQKDKFLNTLVLRYQVK